jgi:hypothetical protein
MKQRPRIYYTEAQKALMWDRWKAGDSLHEIGKLFERPRTSIHNTLSATGGIRPPARHRPLWLSARKYRAAWPQVNPSAALPGA